MNTQTRVTTFGLATLLGAAALICFFTSGVFAQAPVTDTAALQVASISASGKLQKPADLANWVFVGTSLGMGYNPGSFNASRPGQFQVVLMEPQAHAYFVEHGRYAPGSMFVLAFYDADTAMRSNNQQGFTQAEMTNYEIHLIRGANAREDHVFYLFGAKDSEGAPLPPGNACVRCHLDHGAFDGTFAQFYPVIRPHLSKEVLKRASKVKDIH
jgi:hypothetical protein